MGKFRSPRVLKRVDRSLFSNAARVVREVDLEVLRPQVSVRLHRGIWIEFCGRMADPGGGTLRMEEILIGSLMRELC